MSSAKYTLVKLDGTILRPDGTVDPMAAPALLIVAGMGRQIVVQVPYPVESPESTVMTGKLIQAGIFQICAGIIRNESELIDGSVQEVIDGRAIGWPGWAKVPDALAGRPVPCPSCDARQAVMTQAAANLQRVSSDLLGDEFRAKADRISSINAHALISMASLLVESAPPPTSEVLFGSDPSGSSGKYLDPETAKQVEAALRAASNHTSNITNNNHASRARKAIDAIQGNLNKPMKNES